MSKGTGGSNIQIPVTITLSDSSTNTTIFTTEGSVNPDVDNSNHLQHAPYGIYQYFNRNDNLILKGQGIKKSDWDTATIQVANGDSWSFTGNT